MKYFLSSGQYPKENNSEQFLVITNTVIIRIIIISIMLYI